MPCCQIAHDEDSVQFDPLVEIKHTASVATVKWRQLSKRQQGFNSRTKRELAGRLNTSQAKEAEKLGDRRGAIVSFFGITLGILYTLTLPVGLYSFRHTFASVNQLTTRVASLEISLMKAQLALCAYLLVSLTSSTSAQTFFYVGASGGDFFDESNWNDMADGTGSSPVGDLIPDDSTGAIALDLIIDGTSAVAAGQVDIGTGSLSLLNGAMLDMTASGSIIDFNPDSSFTLTNSTLTADDDIVMEGLVNLTGGSVVSVNDDVEFQDALNVSVDGTTFSSGDNTFFDSFSGSIVNASITSADRLGLRQSVAVVVTDTMIDVQGGNGDVDDVFDAAGTGSSLTLLGTSTLLADTIEEGVDLILGDSSTATLGGNGVEILDNGSTATLLTTDAVLQINAISDDPRAFIINGLTGLSYADDSSTWNVTNWNGTDPVSLQIVPEPASLVLMVVCILGIANRRSRAGRVAE